MPQGEVRQREWISLCMIVKDEEATLEAAILSFKDIVDEIVIGVDDSCTDKTPEIARKYATNYFTFTWKDDFSTARNMAIDRAKGTLIIILDGHEILCPEGIPLLRQSAMMYGIDPNSKQILTPRSYLEQMILHGMDKRFDVACFNLAMNVRDDFIPQLFFLQPRLFRNNGKIRYQSKVHNHLTGYEAKRTVGVPECILVHNMPTKREEKRKKQREKMNVQGLKAEVEAHPNNSRSYFYLGNTYADLGNIPSAIRWYERYLKKASWHEERYQALQQLGLLYYRHRKNLKRARECLIEALMICHNRREPYMLLAEIAFEEKNYDQVIHWANLAETIDAPFTVMFLQGSVYTYMPHVLRMKAYRAAKSYNRALEYCQRALETRPNDKWLITQREELRNTIKEAQTQQNRENMLIIDGAGSFTADLAQVFSSRFNVSRRTTVEWSFRAWADVVWLEWCDQNAIDASFLTWNCPVICRLHSYEAYSNFIDRVQWQNIDHLVFVAEHIKKLALRRYPDLSRVVKMSVIPNGIDPDRFKFKKRSPGKKVAYLGYLNEKKNIPLLIEIIKTHPDYEFHIAGTLQGNHLSIYFERELSRLHNVWFYGWVDPEQKDSWLEDKNYLISTSLEESFGYSIAEAMCKGIKPLIVERPGAIWTETFEGVDDFRALAEGPYDSLAYRTHIEQNYHLKTQMDSIAQLITSLFASKPTLPTVDYHPRIVEGLSLISNLDVEEESPAEEAKRLLEP